MTTKYYRYQEFRYSNGVDQFDNAIPGHILKVELLTFDIVKHTPKGVWIEKYGHKRFVLNTARKKYACSNKLDALGAFLARKNRHLAILRKQIKDVEIAIYQAGEIREEMCSKNI